MIKYPKLTEIVRIEGYNLFVRFDNNTIKKIDFSVIIAKEPFFRLQDYNLFKNVKIDQGGYGLVWSDDLDISESWLWDNGEKVSQGVA